jgi:hypothetical protein
VPETFDKVVISWPKSLINASEVQKSGPRRSWIQLARTGSFTSNRYGKFSITRDDLSQMLHNFNNITPKKPTELPIDYDHLSMDPKKPGDGIAAGWMKSLELRGDELWAEVEWTPDGAKRVDAGEYRFISPSFVKDHTHKDGKKIGTTLLAAAVTNHPFLEGMKSLTLSNDSVFGSLGVSDDAEVVNLSAQIGQRVMIAPGHARTADEMGSTFEIVDAIGEGEDCFVALKDLNGVLHKWFKATELLPSSATPASPLAPNLVASPGTPAALQPGSGLPADAAAGAPGAVDPAADPVAAAMASGDPAEMAAAIEEDPEAAAAAMAEDPEALPMDPDALAEDELAGETDEFAGDEADAEDEGFEEEVASDEETTEDDEEPTSFLRKRAMAAKQKGTVNMRFQLRNDKNEVIEVTAEQLAAAGIQVVPEGATVIGKKDLNDLRSKVTNLSSTVEELRKSNEESLAASRQAQMQADLDRLSGEGYITKPQREFALSTWGEASEADMKAFGAWAKTFTKPVVHLNREHGIGGDADVESREASAGSELIDLANDLADTKNLSMRDAMIEASRQRPDLALAYREHYAD